MSAVVKRKTLEQRAEYAAELCFPDVPHLGAFSQNRRALHAGYLDGWLAGYRAAKREKRK